MAYVDGFVVAVPTAKRAAYLEIASLAAAVFKENGAIEVVECWGDDVPDGELTSFPMAVERESDETVVFAWVKWASKEARDRGNAKVMADPRMQPSDGMPFDGKRMIFGGFEVLFEA